MNVNIFAYFPLKSFPIIILFYDFEKWHSTFPCNFKKNDYISYCNIYLLLWEMNIRQLEEIAQKLWCFSLQQIQVYEPDFLRINLIRRMKQWYIKRITKWRYTLSSTTITEQTLAVYSNTIYSPSYVSMESALRYYDLIPEWVYMTTACTTKKTQTLSWDLGNFYYYHIKPSLFRGYSMQDTIIWWIQLIAQVEKALCDFFYLKSYLAAEDIEELRIDTNHLRELTTPERLYACAQAFNHKRLESIIASFILVSTQD